MLRTVIDYARFPSRMRREYSVVGQRHEQFALDPMVVKGPCLVAISSNFDGVGVSMGLLELDWMYGMRRTGTMRRSAYFYVGQGIFGLKLKLELPGRASQSLRLFLTRPKGLLEVKLWLEVRSHNDFIELPDKIMPLSHAFPVIQPAAISHHL